MSLDGIPDPDEMITCPFENHDVPAKRMQYHLMKCKKNHPHLKYFVCPFNACHIKLNKREMEDHISSCPQRSMIEPTLTYEMQKRNGVHDGAINKGYTDLPSYDENSVVPQTEDWDEEMAPLERALEVEQDYYSNMRNKHILIRQRSDNQQERIGIVEKKEEYPQAVSQQSPPLLYSALSVAGVGRGQACSNQNNDATHSSGMLPIDGQGLGCGRGMLPPSMMRSSSIKPEHDNEETETYSVCDTCISSKDTILSHPTSDNSISQKFNAITSQIYSVGIGRGKARDNVKREVTNLVINGSYGKKKNH